MNPARLTALIEAYVLALHAEIKLRPTSWLRFPGDTAEAKAVRVASAVHGLIAGGSLDLVQADSDAFKRACAALGIPEGRDAVRAYLES